MKCALDCVHTCLAKCAHAEGRVNTSGGSQCYADCTKPCLPKCITPGSGNVPVEALAAAAEAHASGKSVMPSAKVPAPDTAVMIESN